MSINKKIYFIQPTYRRMDGSLVKGWTLFNHSLNLSMLSGAVPADWSKEFCLEYYDEVNYDTDASVVVICCMGYDIMRALEMAKKLKSKRKKIIFGAHMDDFSEAILGKVCDSFFYGMPTPDDMKNMLEDLLADSLHPKYQFGMNINYPFDYTMLKGKRMPFIQIIGSQGCINKCKYCCTAGVYKGRYQLRKIEFIISDLKNIRDITRYVSFIDPNIYNNREYLKRLCSRIISERIGVHWGAQSTINIGNDREVLNLLYQSGCRVLFIGLETLEQENLEIFGKEYLTDKYSEYVKNIRKAGINVVGYFMMGLDRDTLETFENTYRFIRQSHLVLPIINVLLPVPGTAIYDQLKSEGRILVDNFEKFLKDNPLYSVPCQHIFFTPRNMTAAELESGFIKLAKRLFTTKEIFKRSIIPNPLHSFVLLLMNFELRRKYMAMSNSFK